jgi:tetraacyldisaccharide 4'-kinase
VKARGKTGDAVVVSVGNIEVGGNGKTPFAAYLVGELTRRGQRPAYVSRGFKSEAEGLGAATVLVPGSTDPCGALPPGVRILRSDSPVLSRAVGDEGAMIARRCPDAPLGFGRDRRRAVDAVSALFAPTHIVLDDAFQSWRVARDADIVLLDARHPLGNGRVIPAGSLREGVRALERADAIGFNGIESGLADRAGSGGAGGEVGCVPAGALSEARLEPLREWTLRAVTRPVPIFGIRRVLSLARPGAVGASSAGEEKLGSPVAALSSVGRPRRFEDALARLGVTVGLAIRYPDHYRYGALDIVRIEAILTARGIGGVVTTEKDWTKLRDVGPPRVDLIIARLDLEVVGDDPLRICEKPRGAPAASA